LEADEANAPRPEIRWRLLSRCLGRDLPSGVRHWRRASVRSPCRPGPGKKRSAFAGRRAPQLAPNLEGRTADSDSAKETA